MDSSRMRSSFSAYSKRTSPAGVSSTDLAERSRSLALYACSSWLICALTADCERKTFWPAKFFSSSRKDCFACATNPFRWLRTAATLSRDQSSSAPMKRSASICSRIFSPNFKMHHIYKDRLRFMVSTKNPLAHRSKVTLAEVAEQPLIFPRTCFTRQVLDKLFRPYRARIHVAMELPSIGMIKRFVAADAGLSIISESFAKDYVKAGEVKLLTVEGVDLWRELGLVYRRDRSLPRAAQALIGMIREHRKVADSAEAAAAS